MEWESIKLLHHGGNSDIRKLEEFANQFDFNQCTYFSRPRRFRNFLEGKRGYNVGKNYDTPLGFGLDCLDHGEAFKVKGTTRVVVVGQNYTSIKTLKQELFDKVKPFNLIIAIFSTSKSYYYPGGTCLHMIMTPETYRYYEDAILKDPALVCVM